MKIQKKITLEDISLKITNLDGKIEGLVLNIANGFNEVDERFNDVDERFNKVDERFNKVDERFNEVEDKIKKLDSRIIGINNRLDYFAEAYVKKPTNRS